jgi:hypothetical protein
MTKRAHRNLMAARAKERGETIGDHSNTPANHFAPESSTPPSAAGMGTESCTDYSNNESVDLMEMSAIDRKTLAQGGAVGIYIGKDFITDIQRKLLTATSTKYAELLEGKTDVVLSTECSQSAVSFILDWVNSSTIHNKMRSPRLHRDLDQAIAIRKAAEELGMLRYVQCIMTWHMKNIYHRIPSQDELALVEQRANDYFINLMAGRIAYLIRHNELPTDFDYMTMVAQYPTIAAAIHVNNSRWEQRQEHEARRADSKRQYEERKARREANARARFKQETAMLNNKELRAHLLNKLSQKIRTLTAEERENALLFKRHGDSAFNMEI